jgi:hypothetical protein
MKAVQTRCPQGAPQVLSERRLASTIRSDARRDAHRNAHQCRWLGGGKRSGSGRAAPLREPDTSWEGDRASIKPVLVAGS